MGSELLSLAPVQEDSYLATEFLDTNLAVLQEYFLRKDSLTDYQ